MGCNCGGNRRSAERAMGTNPSNPIIYGNDNPDLPVVRVTHIVGSAGLPAGSTRYVRGTEVQTMIDNELLRSV